MGKHHTPRWICLVLAAGMVCLHSYSAPAEERQYKIESAFLYSFFNYITWPGYTSPQDIKRPVICVYGDDPILSYLDYIRNKMASERALTIRIVTKSEDAIGCHILFIRHRLSFGESHALPNDTLTVFKPDDMLDRGGMIDLFEDGERIAIKVNQEKLDQTGFRISSRLLDLAQRSR